MKLLQDRFKGIHSTKYTAALRAIPTDIAITLPDHQLDALVVSICRAFDLVADEVGKTKGAAE